MIEPYYQDEWLTIYRGDTLQVLPELDGLGVDAVITDPPYSSGGAMRSDRTQTTVTKYVSSTTAAYRPEFSGDNRDQRSYFAWSTLWLAGALHTTNPGAVCAIFTDWRQLPTTSDAIQSGGWVWRGIGVWDKTEGVRPYLGGLTSQCEFVLWGTAGPHQPDRNHRTTQGVIRVPTVRNREHIAQKPEPVMAWLSRLCPPGGVVLDPFMGSGTTLLAARKAGLRCVGIETDERYCAFAAERVGGPIRVDDDSLFGPDAQPDPVLDVELPDDVVPDA